MVTHTGIVSPVGAQDFGSGWNSHLTVLQERLAGRSVRNFWELHAQSREQVEEGTGELTCARFASRQSAGLRSAEERGQEHSLR